MPASNKSDRDGCITYDVCIIYSTIVSRRVGMYNSIALKRHINEALNTRVDTLHDGRITLEVERVKKCDSLFEGYGL